MKYNYQLHQLILALRRKRGGPTLDRLFLPYDDVAIFHFSSEWKPVRYLLQKGIPSFNALLKKFFEDFSCRHKPTIEDEVVRERISDAMKEWCGTFRSMWVDALERIVEGDSEVSRLRCPLCHTAREMSFADTEHCFFGCPGVKARGIAEEANILFGTAYPDASMLQRAVVPGNVWNVVTYVSAVYKLRSLEPTPALGAPRYSDALLVTTDPTGNARPHRTGKKGSGKGREGHRRSLVPPSTWPALLDAQPAHPLPTLLDARPLAPYPLAHPPPVLATHSPVDLGASREQPEMLPSFVRDLPDAMQASLGRFLAAEGAHNDEVLFKIATDPDAGALLLQRAIDRQVPVAAWASLKAVILQMRESNKQYYEVINSLQDAPGAVSATDDYEETSARNEPRARSRTPPRLPRVIPPRFPLVSP